MVANLSACGELVRSGDPVRFRTALFAPPEPREHLFALYAFNLEIAKIAPMVSEPMLGEIRLQWWRETLDQIYADGPIRAHEVVEPLASAVRSMALPRAPFDALIDARASDLDPAALSESTGALESYLENSAGGLTALAAQALAPDMTAEATQVARDAGFAIGAARYLLALPQLVVQGRKPLAMEAVDELAAEGRARLARARAARRALPKAAVPALLETAAAHHALTAQSLRSPFRERLSLLWHGATGRW